MSKKHLSRKPFNCNAPGHAVMWYYEENDGLHIYSDEGIIGFIPSRRIREYIKRKDKKDNKG